MKPRAVFIGRFQPFHKGHLAVIKKLSRKYRLAVVIGSTNQKSGQNPFSANLRRRMIRASLKEVGIKGVRVISMPDVGNDRYWGRKFLNLVGKIDTVITGNPWVVRCLKNYDIKFLKIKEKGRKISATKIRAAMRAGKPWKHLVPMAVVKHLEKIDLRNSLRKK